MPETEFAELPIMRELRDDLAAAYAAREAAPPVRARRRVRAPRRIAVLAAAVAAGFAAVLVETPGDDRSVASVLEAAAVTAAGQPAPAGPGMFAYFSERSAVSSTVDLTLSGANRAEWWVAPDGSGRVLERVRIGNDFERPADDPDAPRYRLVGPRRWVRGTRFGPGEFDRLHGQLTSTVLEPRVDRLPTDPDALEDELTRQLQAAARDDDPESGFRGPVQEYQLLTVIEQLLAHPLASPELRGALYRVAATFEDTTVEEDAQDPAGRPATVLVHTRRTNPGSVRTEIFFDPSTSASLATRSTTTEFGRFSQSWVYTPPASVDSVTARP